MLVWTLFSPCLSQVLHLHIAPAFCVVCRKTWAFTQRVCACATGFRGRVRALVRRPWRSERYGCFRGSGGLTFSLPTSVHLPRHLQFSLLSLSLIFLKAPLLCVAHRSWALRARRVAWADPDTPGSRRTTEAAGYLTSPCLVLSEKWRWRYGPPHELYATLLRDVTEA